jgi:hypothetical protein
MNPETYLGGIIIDPCVIFGKQKPTLRGIQEEICDVCFREFIISGQVQLYGLYVELRKKHPDLSVMYLLHCTESYRELRDSLLAEKRDFGQPYCELNLTN